jgi:RimJ/RimL family protein N-acetyltransferase
MALPDESAPASPPGVTLRMPRPADLPILYSFECDPAWTAMAMAKPRTAAAFEAAWAQIFRDWAAGRTDVVQKIILADGEVCGTIGCRLLAGRHVIGYGLGRAYWGRGIASRALGHLLAELPMRPLYATAAASNAASIRVLAKHGFVIAERRTAPETERSPAREEVVLMLA